jgi:hypothetical protein
MNYDDWKLMTPEEDYEHRGGKICPFCGAWGVEQCEMVEETDGVCAWEESEPDPDQLMEERREDREMEAQFPRSWDDEF